MSYRLLSAILIVAIAAGSYLAAFGRGQSGPALTAADLATKGPLDTIVLGMGCFWGSEKRMSTLPGIVSIEAGYANGEIAGNYSAIHEQELQRDAGRSNLRNHAEVIKVTFDTSKVSLERVLVQFWENHDPTQGDRQGNDIGSNYRSAIYTTRDAQTAAARQTRDVYQKVLSAAGYGTITTEIAPLKSYYTAEEYHQHYLIKNPQGYCGLGGTGVKYPASQISRITGDATPIRSEDASVVPLDPASLNQARQLIVFEGEDCDYCRKFKADVLDHWTSPVPVARTLVARAPGSWVLEKPLAVTPTIVLFENGHEVSRYTGYNGEQQRFWKWLGFYLLTPEQRKIAFEQGTERAWTGSNLDEKRAGTFVDPISGVALFRSDTKFESGTGWPSFFQPLPGAVELRVDRSFGTTRTEVVSASSGIHLGHVFDDGPPPTGKRYCINGDVLKFVPDRS